MKARLPIVLRVITILAAAAMALALAPTQDRPAAGTQGIAHPHFAHFADLQWEAIPLPGSSCTSEVARLHLDPATQAAQMLIRTPDNCHVPRHWHTANESVVVITGTFIMECDGKEEALGPGSFGYIPGKMIHQAWTKDGESLLYVAVDAAWDVNWVNGPPKQP